MAKGQIIGNVYRTWRKRNQIFRLYNAFGISINILVALKQKGINNIEIVYDDGISKWLYKSSVGAFLESELEYKGSGGKKDIQRFIPLAGTERFLLEGSESETYINT